MALFILVFCFIAQNHAIRLPVPGPPPSLCLCSSSSSSSLSLSSSCHPFHVLQYKQAPLKEKLLFANVAMRLLLNKVAPLVVSKPAFFLLQDHTIPYTEVMMTTNSEVLHSHMVLPLSSMDLSMSLLVKHFVTTCQISRHWSFVSRHWSFISRHSSYISPTPRVPQVLRRSHRTTRNLIALAAMATALLTRKLGVGLIAGGLAAALLSLVPHMSTLAKKAASFV